MPPVIVSITYVIGNTDQVDVSFSVNSECNPSSVPIPTYTATMADGSELLSMFPLTSNILSITTSDFAMMGTYTIRIKGNLGSSIYTNYLDVNVIVQTTCITDSIVFEPMQEVTYIVGETEQAVQYIATIDST
eukprot:GHVR01122846.1.p1 GENE.GHVR01122846.1~~GHVR01122846.1.p1  ORF type:complete len:133 (-),score=0.54 GHVR01122846.1:390-788(-)